MLLWRQETLVWHDPRALSVPCYRLGDPTREQHTRVIPVIIFQMLEIILSDVPCSRGVDNFPSSSPVIFSSFVHGGVQVATYAIATACPKYASLAPPFMSADSKEVPRCEVDALHGSVELDEEGKVQTSTVFSLGHADWRSPVHLGPPDNG